MAEKPKTRDDFSRYRLKTSCAIGKNVLNGEVDPPLGVSRLEYAIYNLLCAIEELNILTEKNETPISNHRR